MAYCSGDCCQLFPKDFQNSIIQWDSETSQHCSKFTNTVGVARGF